jgi:uncharacterized membrane protein
MTDPVQNQQNRHPSKGMAGGFFIMIALLAGSIIGIIYDEPSMGMIIGFAIGVILAIAIWLIDSRKN